MQECASCLFNDQFDSYISGDITFVQHGGWAWIKGKSFANIKMILTEVIILPLPSLSRGSCIFYRSDFLHTTPTPWLRTVRALSHSSYIHILTSCSRCLLEDLP